MPSKPTRTRVASFSRVHEVLRFKAAFDSWVANDDRLLAVVPKAHLGISRPNLVTFVDGFDEDACFCRCCLKESSKWEEKEELSHTQAMASPDVILRPLVSLPYRLGVTATDRLAEQQALAMAADSRMSSHIHEICCEALGEEPYPARPIDHRARLLHQVESARRLVVRIKVLNKAVSADCHR